MTNEKSRNEDEKFLVIARSPAGRRGNLWAQPEIASPRFAMTDERLLRSTRNDERKRAAMRTKSFWSLRGVPQDDAAISGRNPRLSATIRRADPFSGELRFACNEKQKRIAMTRMLSKKRDRFKNLSFFLIRVKSALFFNVIHRAVLRFCGCGSFSARNGCCVSGLRNFLRRCFGSKIKTVGVLS